tara:strand:- start:2615 stop:3319 length:705 start_codon:yes stop_codon:yes gene_type:complete
MTTGISSKTVVITGATGGIGYEIAKKFSKDNNKLVLLGRDKKKLSNLADELNAEILLCDFTDEGSIKELAKEISENYSVDILINSAGEFHVKSIEETSIEAIRETFEINFFSPFILTKYLIPNMIDKKWGRVVNIISSSAYGAAPNTSAYSSSKHALLGLSRGLFNELKNSGVRVLAVSPGSVKTKMGEEVEKLGQIYETFIEPSEVAEYVFYVTSLDDNLILEESRLNRIQIQ